jgi:hypothetical protein
MIAFFTALGGFFTFFDECYQLIQGLKQTPKEKHAAVMTKVAEVFDETNTSHLGRPDWNS